MIEAKLFRDERVVEVVPSGALKAVDFEQLAALVDPFIEAAGALQGLMIVADRFPGWDSFAGLIGHLRFVRDHHQKVRRIAVVSDSKFLSVAPKIASQFVHAQLRTFDAAERSAGAEQQPQPQPQSRLDRTAPQEPQERQQKGRASQPRQQAVRPFPPVDGLERIEAHAAVKFAILRDGLIF